MEIKSYVGNKKQTQNTRLFTLTYKIYLPLQTSEHKVRDEQKPLLVFPIKSCTLNSRVYLVRINDLYL